MFELIAEYAMWGFAVVNIAAISVELCKKIRHTSNASQRVRKRPNKRRKSAEDVFVTINPYLLGLTYAYSAYRFINQSHDPVAYVGTCIAAGQLYLENKTANASHKNNGSTVTKRRKYEAASF